MTNILPQASFILRNGKMKFKYKKDLYILKRSYCKVLNLSKLVFIQEMIFHGQIVKRYPCKAE